MKLNKWFKYYLPTNIKITQKNILLMWFDPPIKIHQFNHVL